MPTRRRAFAHLSPLHDNSAPEWLGCVTSPGGPLLEAERLRVFDFDVTSRLLPSTPEACDAAALSRTEVWPERVAMDGDRTRARRPIR